MYPLHSEDEAITEILVIVTRKLFPLRNHSYLALTVAKDLLNGFIGYENYHFKR